MRTTEDIEELQLRARLRLERRRTGRDGVHLHPGRVVIGRCLPCVREAAALVAALDGMLDDNMERWAHGDR